MRIFARIFLPLFTIYTLTLPARAYAIVPLIMAAARIASIAIKTPAGEQVLGAAIGVGIAITAMTVTRTDGTNSRSDTLYTTNSPRPLSREEAAAGWTSGTNSSSPVPPVSAAITTQWNGSTSYGGFFATPDAACSNQVRLNTYIGTGATFMRADLTGASGGYQIYTCYGRTAAGVGPYFAGYVYETAQCPAGYVVNGAACSLADATVVNKPSDGQCPLVRVGNSYAADVNDPDCGNGQAPLVTTDATGATHSLNDSLGSNFKFHINADGSSSITTDTPDTATNTTKRRSVVLAPPANDTTPPVVTGVRDETISGTGSQAGVGASAGAVPTTVDPALTAAVAANTAAVNDLKNELAATGEVPVVAGGAVTAAATLATDFAKQADDVTKRADGLGLPSLPAFMFPHFAPATCTPMVWNALGHQVTFDICPYVPAIKSIESWILYVLTAFASFSMLMNFRVMRLRA